MKKAILSLCCVILLLLVSPVVTFAADPLYRMLYADEVESFKQDQDAMIVGQLTGKQGDQFNVKVLKVLSGKVSSDMILVSVISRMDGIIHYRWLTILAFSP